MPTKVSPMPPIQDHPDRYAMVNELHARPAAKITAPATATFFGHQAAALCRQTLAQR